MKLFMKIMAIVIWFIVAIITIDSAFVALSAANTIMNILGVFLFVIFIFISYTSKCFTYWKFFNNNKKD